MTETKDMDEAKSKKPVRVLVWQGGGAPPGYEWTVNCLTLAYDDATRLLDDGQYEYIAMQVRDLAQHKNPMISSTLDVDKVETFWELREKGGPLGKGVNVRVFFDTVDQHRVLRILGVDVKKKEGHTSVPVKERIQRRQRKWDAGEYPLLLLPTPFPKLEKGAEG